MPDQLPKNTGDEMQHDLLSLQIGPDVWEPYYFDDDAWQRMRCILSSWLGTPYRHCTMVKGRGADCTLFIGACWKEQGILKDVSWDYYSKDWHLHTREEMVLNGLYKHFCADSADDVMIMKLHKDVPLIRGDLLSFALTATGVSNHAAMYIGNTERGRMILHSAQSKGVSLFPLKGYFDDHKSHVFRIMRKL